MVVVVVLLLVGILCIFNDIQRPFNTSSPAQCPIIIKPPGMERFRSPANRTTSTYLCHFSEGKLRTAFERTTLCQVSLPSAFANQQGGCGNSDNEQKTAFKTSVLPESRRSRAQWPIKLRSKRAKLHLLGGGRNFNNDNNIRSIVSRSSWTGRVDYCFFFCGRK